MDVQGMFVDAADPEHPAVSRATAHRPPDLIGKSLKRDLIISLSQSAANRSIRSVILECATERRDGLLVAPAHHVHEAMKRHQARRQKRRVLLDLVAVDRLQE